MSFPLTRAVVVWLSYSVFPKPKRWAPRFASSALYGIFFPPPSRGFSYLYPFLGSAPTKAGFVQQISSPCLPPSAASSSPSQRLGSIDLGELCPSCNLNLAPRHFQESQSDGTAVTRSATAGHPYTWNCVALGFLCSFDARSTVRKSRGGFHES